MRVVARRAAGAARAAAGARGAATATAPPPPPTKPGGGPGPGDAGLLGAASRQRGALLVWGRPDDRRLGMPLPAGLFSAADTLRGPAVETPVGHPGVPGGAAAVEARAAKTIAAAADGSVWSWGSCSNLSLGHGEAVTSVASPKRVEALAGIRIVSVRG